MDEADEEFRNRSTESSPIFSRAAKRPRTTLACQRCKSRKQKCDGREPSCSQCIRVSATCQYVASTLPKPTEQRAYVKALESRIADLESRLKRAEQSANLVEPQESYRLSDLPPESSLSSTIRDLSLNASGYSYLGGTSNITIARVLEPVLHIDRSQATRHDDSRTYGAEGDPLVTRIFPSNEDEDALDVASFSDPMVEKLFRAYIEYVSLIFPILHSQRLQDMHERRDKPNGLFEVAVLHLVYALGGITLTLSGNKGDFKSEYHYEAAMAHRSRIIQCIDRRAIIYLTLASLYCLRAPRNPGPWTMIGLAVKLCISLGLHRKSCTSKLSLGSELDKRLFWTCYCLDRDINLTIGRPPSICDHDIDCQLPLDVDEDSINPEHFRAAMRRGPGSVSKPPTTLSYFIHMVSLKRIASDIQHSVYRVDRPVDFSDSITESFLARLNEWKQDIPPESSLDPVRARSSNHFDTPARLHWRGSYMIQYYSCIRLLLFPRLMDDASIDSRCLKVVLEACSGVCRSFKQLHQRSTTMYYSPLFTMSLFLAGLTLIFCTWKAPEEALNLSTTNALSDCTIMLYVMAERWPKAGRYRDTFERLKLLILGRETIDEKDDNIVLDPPPGSASHETELGAEHSARINSTRNESSRRTGTSMPIQDGGASRNGIATGSVIPNVIRNLVREPFPLWEDESFKLNFEALMPTGEPSSNDIPWTGGDAAFDLGNTTSPFDFTFSPAGFGQPSDYDFDPVTFDYSPSGAYMNEYGGILEGVANNRPGTRL